MGSLSLKKQNLTKLKPYSIDGGTTAYNNTAVYIFKGGSTNTISTVFDYLEFTGGTASTADLIQINSTIYYYKTGIGAGWKNSLNQNATNTVINIGDIIYFSPRSLKEISVRSGAIIQKYYSGKLIAEKTIFSFSSPSINNSRLIDFNTVCVDENNDYYETAANPFEIPFNVQLPRKPKKITVKLNKISADDAGLMLIVLKNPSGKVSAVLFLRSGTVPQYQMLNVDVIINDDYPNKIFSNINNFPINNTTVYGKPNIPIPVIPQCDEDYNFGQTETNVIVVKTQCDREIGINDYCSSGFIIEGFTLAGVTSIRRFYYTRLNKLIDENYNGTWKIYCWNNWAGDPSDVQNTIHEGIDLIFGT